MFQDIWKLIWNYNLLSAINPLLSNVGHSFFYDQNITYYKMTQTFQYFKTNLFQQIKQLIQSVKFNDMTQKYSLNSTDNFFFTNANMLPRGKSMDLRILTKDQRKKQIQFMYDQYNLFKYGKVLTSRPRISSVRKSLGDINNINNNLNPQIKRYKNSKQILNQSKKLGQRLGSLKCERGSMFDKVKKYVNV